MVWAGPAPKFDEEGCELHSFDIEGHPEITAGLSNVVVVAEPLDASNQSWFRSGSAPREEVDADGEPTLEWSREHGPHRVATVRPNSQLTVTNEVPLKFFADKTLVQALPATTGENHLSLPEGIIKVVDDSGRTGWIYVTPYPHKVSSGNCRFVFDLPEGSYLLAGWHPSAGRRSLRVSVKAKEKTAKIQLLTFGSDRKRK